LASGSTKSVLAALAANTFVTLLKLVAFLASGSASMLSETIHSFADTGNQVLLFVGLRRGARRADREHHYGYAGERFIFGLLSASGVFFIGCGVTVYHGINGVLTPHHPQVGVLTFGILGASMLVEGSVFVYAVVTAMRAAKAVGSPSLGTYLRKNADPATLAVLMEDGVAVFGLLLASAGVGLTYWTGNPIWDAVGSIVVGILLGVVAVVLVLENRALLLGKAAPAEIETQFAELLRARRSVRYVQDIKSRQLSPDEFILKAEIAFDGEFIAERLEAEVTDVVALEDPETRRGVLRTIATSATRILAEEIDAMEAAVRAEIPGAKHIDLEVDRGTSALAFVRSKSKDKPRE